MPGKKRKCRDVYDSGAVVEIEPSADQVVAPGDRWYARIDSWDGSHYKVAWIYGKQELCQKLPRLNHSRVCSGDFIQTDHTQRVAPDEIRGRAPTSLPIRFSASVTGTDIYPLQETGAVSKTLAVASKSTANNSANKSKKKSDATCEDKHTDTGAFRTTGPALSELFASKIGLLTDQPICDTAWVAEKKQCIRRYRVLKAKNVTREGQHSRPHIELTLKDNDFGKVWYHVPHHALLSVSPWPKSNVSTMSIPDGPCHQESRERSDWLADRAVTLLGSTEMILVLDGPYLETTRALVRRGITPSQVIVAEINPATCVHQLLLVRGTPLESVNILYCKLHVEGKQGGVEQLVLEDRFAKYNPLLESALKRIKCLYLDYCGDVPTRATINSVIDKLSNLELIGFTRCKRNPRNPLPQIIPGWTRTKEFQHSKVDTSFFQLKSI